MIGNNSCGVHSVMSEFYGPGPLTVDQVVELDILTYDGHRMTVGAVGEDELARIVDGRRRPGRIYRGLRDLRDRHEHADPHRFPDIPRRVSGFNLDRLLPEHGFDVAQALVGTEGTCVVVLHATVRLIDAKPARTLVVLGYPDAYTAADDVPKVREHRPVGLEGIDDKLVEYMRRKGLHPDDVDLLPDGHAFLLVEFGGDTKADTDAQATNFVSTLTGDAAGPSSRCSATPGRSRSSGRCASRVSGPRPRFPGCPRPIRGGRTPRSRRNGSVTTSATSATLLDEFGYDAALYGHFGQGCIHCRIDFTLDTRARRAPVAANSSTGPPTWSSRTAVRCRASTATARPGPPCSRRCTATSWSARSPTSRTAGIPTGR